MRINSINRQCFCAKPDETTKQLLMQMETMQQDTQPIAALMNKIYIGNYVSTRISNYGNVRMDIYDKNGEHVVNILDPNDKEYVDSNTYKLKDANGLKYDLYKSLLNLAISRTDKQKIHDKVNGQFHEGR